MSYSRVVHCRIPLTTLAGCVLLLKGLDVPLKNAALSTIVSNALTGLIVGLVRQEIIPAVSGEDEAIKILEELNILNLALPTGIPTPEDFVEQEEELHIAEASIPKELGDRIDTILNASQESPIIPSASISTESIPDREPITVRLDEQPRLEWDEILGQCAPDDLLVEGVRDNPVGRLALGVVYKNLSKRMWNSETANALLIKLIQDANND